MTKEVLNKLSATNYKYLCNLSDTAVKAQNELSDYKQQTSMVEQCKATARGYIKGLIDSNVLSDKDFRFVWSWFMLSINYPAKGVR